MRKFELYDYVLLNAELEELVGVYRAYKEAVRDRDEARDLLEKPLEDEFRELVKDEYREKAERTAVLEDQLRILLIPKDPNDQKNVIMEIRSGAGGEEAALFAALERGLPVSSGCALGLDRLCMIFCDTDDIGDVRA